MLKEREKRKKVVKNQSDWSDTFLASGPQISGAAALAAKAKNTAKLRAETVHTLTHTHTHTHTH